MRVIDIDARSSTLREAEGSEDAFARDGCPLVRPFGPTRRVLLGGADELPNAVDFDILAIQ